MNTMEIRYQRLHQAMQERELDAVYVSAPENHLYMSHFDNPDGYLLITADEAYVFADFRYTEAAHENVFPCCIVKEPGKPALSVLVAEKGLKRIGYEDESLTCAALSGLQKKMPEVEFVPTGDMFSQIRCRKTEDEVENIIAAQRIAEGAFQHILSVIHYDMTETEVAAELEYYMKKNGSEKPSFDTICVSGSNSSRPHGVPRPVKLEKGFLTMDYGAMVNGYHSDMTRTIALGYVSEKMDKVYHTVLEAQLAGIAATKAGVTGREMDAAARNVINAAGFEGCFGHSYGHSLGLLIHEAPNANTRNDKPMPAGAVVSAEPGIYIPDEFGVRIEDVTVITETGCEILTKSPKNLIIL